MLVKALIPTLALAASVNAHAYVLSVWKNGEDMFDAASTNYGTTASFIRSPKSNSPVQDITSSDLACNVNGKMAVDGWLSASPGDTLEPEWTQSGTRGVDAIAESHLGPITAWIAPYESNGEGDVWVKIAAEAWSTATNDWAVQRMIKNKSRNTVKLPSTLAAGKYLVRFDLLALHSASTAPPNGAQFYPSCAQLEVTGSGSQALPTGIAIPGAFKANTPGITWDIYYSPTYDVKLDYIIPGPAVWDGSATYPTAQCMTPLDGLAEPGFCYDGAVASPAKPATSAAAAAPAPTSAAPVAASSTAAAVLASSAAPSAPAPSSAPVYNDDEYASAAPVDEYSSVAPADEYSSAAPVAEYSSAPAPVVPAPSAVVSSATYVAATPSTSAAAGPAAGSVTTPVAPASEATDYSSCMRLYNVCLDEANAKQAAAGGGAVDFSACANTCSSFRKMRRVARGHATH